MALVWELGRSGFKSWCYLLPAVGDLGVIPLSEPPCLFYEGDRRVLQGLWGLAELGLDPSSTTPWLCS